MDRPLRIALVSPYAHYAGHHWQMAQGLAEAFTKKGHTVDVITTVPPIEEPRPGSAREFVTVLSSKWKWRPAWKRSWHASLAHNLESILCFIRLFWTQRQRRYDAWHLIDSTFGVLFLAARFSPVPIFYHLWGEVRNLQPEADGSSVIGRFLGRIKRWLMRSAMETGKMAMFCETAQMEQWNKKVFGPDVYQVYYAVELQPHSESPTAARKKLGIPEGKLVLLMFGTHRVGKDYETVIRGAHLANAPVFLLFAGKTISSNDPAVLLAKHPYPDAMVIEKFISAEEVPTIFGASDVVVLPYAEGYTKGSGVLFEAFQHSRASLSTDTGFLKEFIEEHRCGFLFRYGDAADFARAVREILSLSPEEKGQLEENISAAAHRFSYECVIERYLEIYGMYLPVQCG